MMDSRDYLEISETVEIHGYSGDFKLYFNKKTGSYKAINDNNTLYYRLIKPINHLTMIDKKDILDYCLGDNNYHLQSEKVHPRDLFLHGVYVMPVFY